MNHPINALIKLGIPKKDLDYHVVRAAVIIIFLIFGYQKWFDYEAQTLIPFISNGPLISWMYPVFGISVASWFLGVSEWLLLEQETRNSWGRRFLCHIHNDHHNYSIYARWLGCIRRWFPAMTDNVPFLMKDLVLFAASIYLLKQDVATVAFGVQRTRVEAPRVAVESARA
jgi:uncharacterized membrane protein YkgB